MTSFNSKCSRDSISPIGSSWGNVLKVAAKVMNEFKLTSETKVAAWNVQSMFQSGKMHSIVTEMERMQIHILGISDVRGAGSGECATNSGIVCYSGTIENPEHRYGVAIMITKEINTQRTETYKYNKEKKTGIFRRKISSTAVDCTGENSRQERGRKKENIMVKAPTGLVSLLLCGTI
ncbi:hypothetical protein ILUMI_10147 [Ignelater luminosus]|uniref:Craniofacial development protein 2-like n=1 Tax=Ignelater luminosus TaxID=2038154 RepID=A0A8K0D0Z5_IGNLU|nr:hypothetical protein ILUMI_10147 [Ignelater luminosus]